MLLEHLKFENTFACATIRSTRKGLPQLFISRKAERGTYDYRISDQDILVIKWKDTKDVNLISNFHGTEITEVRRKKRDGTSINVTCPMAIQHYNEHMGGIDKANMLRRLYCLDRKSRKSRKWWHRLFFGMIEITLVNSYVAYVKLFPKVSLLEYRRTVANCLIMECSGSRQPANIKRRKSNFSVSHDVRIQNVGVHWVKFVETRGRCEVCSQLKVESRPFSICKSCNVHLCCNKGKNCFAVYHDLQ